MEYKNSRNVYFFIFAISGFSGLIYESIWTHYLKLFLGHAAYAQTLVLAIFMGGMAIGAWLCSRYSVKWGNVFVMYAVVEGIVGLSALVFHPVFQAYTNISFLEIIPGLNNASLVDFYKWTSASLLILPQSILLGMTFPLMSAGVIRRFPGAPGNTISILYFANSLGGAIGVLTSGFMLVKWIGLPGTIVFAGFINISLALIVWSISKNTVLKPMEETRSTETPDIKQKKIYLALLSIAFITGVASFIYEIAWIRMLSLVLGASTHAFELMLSAFIFGLAAGGFWIRKRIDKFTRPVITLAWVQIIMGLFAMTTLILYGNSFGIMQWLIQNLEKTGTGYTLFNISSHAIALAIMFPATFCAGMTLPLLTYSLIKQGNGEKSIGIIYSANTVGAIIGIFFAVHIGFQLLGLKGLIIFGATLDIIAGIVLLWWFGAYKSFKIPVAATASAVLVIILFILFIEFNSYYMASGVYRNASLMNEKTSDILDHQDGKTASVDLIGNKGGIISIRTNGKTDAAINMSPDSKYSSDEATMVIAAAIPLLLKPDAEYIANIGLGSGLTSHVTLQSGNVKQVDTIEIEQAMVDVARGFWPRNQSVYSDPRSKIYIEDAKTFFSTYNKKYDIIISEPSNPWVSGVSGLFSSEFYNLAGRHLKEDGILVQWFQLYEIDTSLVMSVLKALDSGFEYYDIYIINKSDMIIVAKNNAVIPEFNSSMFGVKKFAAELQRIRINNIQDVMLRKVGNEKSLRPLINSYEIAANSDYYPVLDQNAARSRFLKKDALNLLGIILEPIPVLELLGVVKPKWGVTNTTQTAHFSLSIKTYRAQVMRDSLIKNSDWITSNKGTSLYARSARELENILINCNLPPNGDKISVLFNAAIKIVPYLRPAELSQIWTRFESAPCLGRWDSREQLWYDFFKAMGARNKIGIAELSRQLLTNKNDIPSDREKYLVASYMVSNIALGNEKNANFAWNKYKGKLIVTAESKIFFQMLAALSESQPE